MNKLPFGKRNYQLMVLGVVLLALGFAVMAMDSDPYGFGFLGITLSPIIVMVGFIVEIFAILYTPEEEK
jgi:dipeptide/tripeptide permease